MCRLHDTTNKMKQKTSIWHTAHNCKIHMKNTLAASIQDKYVFSLILAVQILSHLQTMPKRRFLNGENQNCVPTACQYGNNKHKARLFSIQNCNFLLYFIKFQTNTLHSNIMLSAPIADCFSRCRK